MAWLLCWHLDTRAAAEQAVLGCGDLRSSWAWRSATHGGDPALPQDTDPGDTAGLSLVPHKPDEVKHVARRSCSSPVGSGRVPMLLCTTLASCSDLSQHRAPLGQVSLRSGCAAPWSWCPEQQCGALAGAASLPARTLWFPSVESMVRGTDTSENKS